DELYWRSLGAHAAAAASRGPVHLNLPFREPLVGDVDEVPPGRARDEPWHRMVTPSVVDVDVPAGRGIVVAGDGAPSSLASAPWPVFADARSRLAGPSVVTHADSLLRVDAVAKELRPDVVVHVGARHASRVVGEWLAASDANEVVLGAAWLDPFHTAASFGAGSPVLPPAPDGWLERWRSLDDAAEDAIDSVLANHAEPTEPAAARAVLTAVPSGAHVMVSSSMPVRDLEWYARPRRDVFVHANRGANGIDGIVSTAVGVALATGAPTACLVGDVALLHDTNALLGLRHRDVTLTVVVVDNDGGGIFSFLPQASTLPSAQFELLFGTPHGVRIEELAAAHGLATLTVESSDALAPAVQASLTNDGARLVVVRTDRDANVAVHGELHAAVAEAAGAVRSG
ncbi:MAG: thiamine pyrophosphate-dependent enzyme, partial [Acidimicrobiales bacterium]